MGLLFDAIVLTVGYAAIRLLGMLKGAAVVGLMPSAGLAFTAVLATLCGLSGAPAPVAGVLILLCSLFGLALAIFDRNSLAPSLSDFWREHRTAGVVLCAALLVPVVSMGVAFAAVQAPLSPHD